MRSSEIRHTFLRFFRDRDHRVWPSASLIPNDPTLLLTVAGMVPFKPYFLGESTPEHPRATSVQKCARTVDIENVGLTTRHLTFFEMLGNFSFGDYFKREAIAWAWELSTQGFGFDPDRIWATVYLDDDEAADLWVAETGIPAGRVVRRGKADNFWPPTGGAGPCGPCSELYYDRGPAHGAEGGPDVDETRYIEFWNLVFMQYEQDAKGNILGGLPAKNVDTGMGLERMAVLLQDVPNVYEIDVLRPMLDRASELTGVPYAQAPPAQDAPIAEAAGFPQPDRRDVSLRVIGEHCRSSAFLIADGVLPSNEGRGYVLRRLLRRVVRHARMLGHEAPIMPAMMESVVSTLGDAWPELSQQSGLIGKIAGAEEDGFTATLRTGLRMLGDAIEESRSSGAGALAGRTAFTLHDTYGFPVDLTVEIAAEHGLDLDRDEFARLMEGQRTRARAAARGARDGEGVSTDTYREAVDRVGSSAFVGYTEDETDTSVGAIVVPGQVLPAAQEGDGVELILPRTPFYPEGGGQLGDHGVIETDTGRAEVRDTVSPLEGLIVHRGLVVAGEINAGQAARAAIDPARRESITRGHTATHLLHATLKEVVGDHAVQSGSAIDAGRFRFDFPNFSAISPDQLDEIERHVNDRIAADRPVEAIETSQADARAMGAVALFGERYGEHVRVVRIGDFSTELCGGTHVGHTQEVGLFSILTEGSIAANLRRIEATTGVDAFRFLSSHRLVADEVARLLKVSPDEVVNRVGALIERIKGLEKELAATRQQAVLSAGAGLLDQAERVNGARVVAGAVEGADRDGLKALAGDLRNRMGSGVVVLGTVTADGSAQLVAMITQDLADGGLTARELLQPGATEVGGGAGGKGDTAQAGGRQGARLGDALEAVRRAARTRLAATA
ncbi:MAG: alanine--tRNA ligase [Nitriliruptorales bacterium]|nr:alanine--tRNA ligase [Nitriliruptorales bacterium]